MIINSNKYLLCKQMTGDAPEASYVCECQNKKNSIKSKFSLRLFIELMLRVMPWALMLSKYPKLFIF